MYFAPRSVSSYVGRELGLREWSKSPMKSPVILTLWMLEGVRSVGVLLFCPGWGCFGFGYGWALLARCPLLLAFPPFGPVFTVWVSQFSAHSLMWHNIAFSWERVFTQCFGTVSWQYWGSTPVWLSKPGILIKWNPDPWTNRGEGILLGHYLGECLTERSPF